MLQTRKDIYALLTGYAPLAAFVGNRIFAGYAPPKGSDFPYVTYSLSSAPRPKTHDQDQSGIGKADRYEYIISVWALDSDQAFQIAEKIDIALDGRSSTGTFVFLYDDASELPIFKDDNSGIVITQLAMTFIAIRKPQ